jgi:hypothetical protein
VSARRSDDMSRLKKSAAAKIGVDPRHDTADRLSAAFAPVIHRHQPWEIRIFQSFAPGMSSEGDGTPPWLLVRVYSGSAAETSTFGFIRSLRMFANPRWDTGSGARRRPERTAGRPARP